MADKHLGAAAWKAYAKGRGYKDAALLKAYEGLEKAAKAAPPLLVAALDEIEKQADLLRKEHKADKELIAWLAGTDKALAAERKAIPAQAASKTKAEAPALDPKGQALLTTAMLPLLQQVKKGGEAQALLALAGKDQAVMLSRTDPGPTGRKLLTTYLAATSPVKFITGVCRFEADAITFVVDGSPGGLAKRVQAALLKQTGLRLPGLRVRGDDPKEVDLDADDEDVLASKAAKPAATPAATKATLTPTAGATTPAVKPATSATATSNAQTAYAARLAKLQAAMQAAAKRAAGDSPKVQALLAFAQGKAREGNHAAALLGLGEVEKALDAALASGSSATAATPSAQPATPAATSAKDAPGKPAPTTTPAVTARPDAKAASAGAKPAFDEAAFRREWAGVKSGWRDALATVDAQVAQLQAALRKLGDNELRGIADQGLIGITGNFKTPVMVAVMEVDNARGEALAKAAQKGVRAAKAFTAYLASEPTVRVTDQNPFGVKMSIRASLSKALGDMEALLAPLA